MKRRVATLLVFVALAGIVMCSEDDGSSHRARNMDELPRFDEPPRLQINEVHWDQRSSVDRERAMQGIEKTLNEVFAIVHSGDLEKLPYYVHPESGVYVDVKAHRTHAQLQADVLKPDSYVNTFFADSGDSDRTSLEEILHLTRTIEAEVFVEGPGEVELQLELTDAPELSYHLNNPVLIERDGVWYIYRLF